MKFFKADGSGPKEEYEPEYNVPNKESPPLVNKLKDEELNSYHEWDATTIPLPENCIDLIITSPPYNAGIDYKNHNDNMPREEYEEFVRQFMSEIYRVLKDDGRLCINIANTGRRPYYSNSVFYTQVAEDLGFKKRGEIIWVKTHAVGGVIGGSWESPSNPSLRDMHEYVLVFHKKDAKKHRRGEPHEMADGEFPSLTASVWEIQTARKKDKYDHPAKMPEILVERLIKLYAFKTDIVYDPFVGSGTVCEVADRMGNPWIGSDNDIHFVKAKQLKQHRKENIQARKQMPIKRPRGLGVKISDIKKSRKVQLRAISEKEKNNNGN